MTAYPRRLPALLRTGLLRIGPVLIVLGLILAARTAEPLNGQITQLLSTPDANNAFWGIYIKDLTTGEVLYSQNPNKLFLPASNQKLITAAGALDAFGSSYRYQTKLVFSGRVNGSVMQGDLVIRGSGDPTFGSSVLSAEGGDPLRAWARQLAAMGVTRIEGRIVGDDDTFDDQPYAEGWDIDYVTSQFSRLLGVSTGGLSYHDNLVVVKLESADVGAAPKIIMRPSAYLKVRNDATTAARRRGWGVSLNRLVGTETISLSGSLPSSYAGTIEMPVTNPTMFTVHTFKHYLQEAGIEVPAETVDIDELDEKLDLANADPLFVYLSPPLSRILAVLNKKSNNFYADQIFRTFAWGGSAAGGERRMKEILARAGVNPDQIIIRDGSGLSRKDMITPQAMVAILDYMYRHTERETFLQSLAGGGEAQTTLRGRLGNAPVHAKTGSLEFVRALSGYTTTQDGRTLAFAIFANNYTGPSYRITQIIDQIVMTMVAPRVG